MPQPTPVTNSRLAWLAIAVWALILALIVGTALVFASRGGSGTGPAGVGSGNALTALAPAADPSADASSGASTAPSGAPAAPSGAPVRPEHPGNGVGPRKLPNLFGFLGRGKGGGPGAFGGPGPFAGGGPSAGRGAISITAINGNQLSLKTDDGWTRTIDATGATITSDGKTITVGDLKVGDQIRFREERNSDGTYKVTTIMVVPARTAGVVQSVSGSTITIKRADGSTQAINVTDATAYGKGGNAGAKADVQPGLQIAAQGSVGSDGSFTATKVQVSPAVAAGQVTAKTGSTITIKTLAGSTTTINVTGSTTYQTRGKQAASLADVAAGNFVAAEGTYAAGGSLNATSVRIFPNAKPAAGTRKPAKNKPAPTQAAPTPAASTTSAG